MQYLRTIAFVLALIGPASAQVQGADPAFMQDALNAVAAQRNNALNEAASAQAQLARAQKEIADLQKQISDLKAKAGANQ